MSTIQAIAFNRLRLAEVKTKFPPLAEAGVYILLGYDEENPDHKVAYIGESERVAERLQYYAGNHQAQATKGFWSDTIALISSDGSLTKSHIRYVEARLIAAAQQNPHWSLRNSQRASEEGKLPRRETSTMNIFFDQSTILVRALGHDLFKSLVGAPTRGNSVSSKGPTLIAEAIFSYIGEGFNAKLRVADDATLTVLTGSLARLHQTNTVPAGIVNLRADLRESGVLVEFQGALRFTDDYQFSSVTAAAATVYAGSVNGRAAWRLADKRSYAEWEEAKQATASPS